MENMQCGLVSVQARVHICPDSPAVNCGRSGNENPLSVSVAVLFLWCASSRSGKEGKRRTVLPSFEVCLGLPHTGTAVQDAYA